MTPTGISFPWRGFLQFQPHAHDPGSLAGFPVAVGGGDDRPVGENFDAWVGGVPALLVVHDANHVLARLALHDHPVTGGPQA